MAFLVDWFKPRIEVRPLIVEVEKPRDVGALDAESAQSVAALAGHPGFQYLLTRLRFQKHLLQAALNNQRQSTLVEVEFLKSGIAWCGWLENQLGLATGLLKRPVPSEPSPDEAAAFNELRKMVEVIGQAP